MPSGKPIFEEVQGKSFVSERGARELCSRFWRKLTMCDDSTWLTPKSTFVVQADLPPEAQLD
jgi:hypothetical protein